MDDGSYRLEPTRPMEATLPCDDLLSFVEGELDEERTVVFRDHLRTCQTCPIRLIETIQLSAHLGELKSNPSS